MDSAIKLFGITFAICACLMLLVSFSRSAVSIDWDDKSLRDPLPAPSSHALEHEEAEEVIEYVNHNGRFSRWDCDDGRVRFVLPWSRKNSTWAVVVVGGPQVITAFVTDSHSYAVSVIENCNNPWHYAHP